VAGTYRLDHPGYTLLVSVCSLRRYLCVVNAFTDVIRTLISCIIMMIVTYTSPLHIIVMLKL